VSVTRYRVKRIVDAIRPALLTVYDGPFLETKELIGGYVIVAATSLAEAGGIAERYLEIVAAEEVDVRELE
jgi:hypothetical protein